MQQQHNEEQVHGKQEVCGLVYGKQLVQHGEVEQRGGQQNYGELGEQQVQCGEQ